MQGADVVIIVGGQQRGRLAALEYPRPSLELAVEQEPIDLGVVGERAAECLERFGMAALPGHRSLGQPKYASRRRDRVGVGYRVALDA
jgi:hypothetical protein